LKYIPEAEEDKAIRGSLAAVRYSAWQSFDIKALSPERKQAWTRR